MTGPSLNTVKRLFAVSGNRCAFPGCQQHLVVDDRLLGEMCHIRGARPGASRYSNSQTDEERHSFGNLILLCPTHHTLVDSNDVTYSVERLVAIKTAHECSHKEIYEMPNALANQLVGLSIAGTIGAIAGAISPPVISLFQSGGQTAHTINNYGPPRRAISEEMRERIFRSLRRIPPAQIAFASTQGDQEAHEFKQQLIEVFRQAGWRVEDAQTFMFFGSRIGLVVTIPFGVAEQGAPQIVLDALSQTGNPVAGNRGDMANGMGIYVQVWHAPNPTLK